MRHPIQPLFKDENGVTRFKKNEIVRRLFDGGGAIFNKIAMWDVPDKDWEE